MLIYWLVYVFAFGMYHVVKANKSRMTRMIYNACMGCIVFLLFAFRDVTMGMHDVAENYVPNFLYEYDMPWDELYKRFTSDALFYFVSKLIRSFTENPHIWLAFMSLPICISITMLINRHSRIAWLSWIMFYSLGFFSWNITVMRQSVAMALGIFSTMALLDGKKKVAFLYWFVAVGFHISAAIAIVPIILDKLKLKLDLKRSLFIIIGTLVVWVASGPILELLFRFISIYRFQRYLLHLSSFNATMMLIYLAIAIFCVVVKFIYTKHDVEYNKGNALLWTYMCSLPFFAMTSAFADLYRLALYFCVYGLICVPNSIAKIRNTAIRLITTVSIVVVLIYYAYTRGLISVAPYAVFF